MKITVRDRWEHRKKSIFAVCSNCREHIKPVLGETEWALCEACRAFLKKRDVTSESFLKKEIEILRDQKNRNLLYTALLYHDLDLLEDLLEEEERDEEIASLREETDTLQAVVGMMLPRLFHQLARILWHEGYAGEAAELLRNTISWITTNCLLFSSDWDDWEQELSSCYWDLALIYLADADDDGYQWALKHAAVHGRMDYERSAGELYKCEQELAKMNGAQMFGNTEDSSDPFCGNYAATMAKVYTDQGDDCAVERKEQAVRYYRKARSLYESVLPSDQKTSARLACVNNRLKWMSSEAGHET